MPINLDKPHRWKSDIAASVDFFNEWFLRFAPQTYQATRLHTVELVEEAFLYTQQLTQITPQIMRQHPRVLAILRMTTAPPIARDRLIGLTGVNPSLVHTMEKRGALPRQMQGDADLLKLIAVIVRLLDQDLFPWIRAGGVPGEQQSRRAATIVADRLCGATSDPLIRNAQEQRQLATLQGWLEQRGYTLVHPLREQTIHDFAPGTFAFRYNVPIQQQGGTRSVNIPIDAVVMPHHATHGRLPILIEAKSAGDFTNTNKRRKEEAIKTAQLRHSYGEDVIFLLLLCGYFNSGYLGYEAAEGIDWVWEHRIDDLLEAGI